MIKKLPQTLLVLLLCMPMWIVPAGSIQAGARLLAEVPEIAGYVLTPDGQGILYGVARDDRSIEIWYVKLSGGPPTILDTLLPPAYEDLLSPVVSFVGWTPDNRHVFIMPHFERQHVERDNRTKIRRVALDGTGGNDLTPYVDETCYNTRALCPHLQYIGTSADSRFSFYLVYGQDPFNLADYGTFIYRVPTLGPMSAVTRLNLPGYHAFGCEITPNKRWLICSNLTQLIQIPTDASQPAGNIIFEKPAPLPSFGLQFRMTPDGLHMIVESQNQLYSVPIGQPSGAPALLSEAATSIGQINFAIISGALEMITVPSQSGILRITAVPVSDPAEAAYDLVPWIQLASPTQGLRYTVVPQSRRLVYMVSEPGFLPNRPISDPSDGIFSVSLDGRTEPIRLSPSPGPNEYLEDMSISADGKWVVYSMKNVLQNDQLTHYRVPIEGPATALIPLPDFGEAVQRYGDSIISIIEGNLYRLRLNDPPTLTALTSMNSSEVRPIVGIQITPDGRLLYTEYSTAQNTAKLIVADLGILQGGFVAPALCANERSGNAQVPIILDAAPADMRTVTYHIAGGTADTSDYSLPISGTVLFEPGQRLARLTIAITADKLSDDGETLLLALHADPASIELTQATHRLTIREQGNCQSFLPMIGQPLALFP